MRTLLKGAGLTVGLVLVIAGCLWTFYGDGGSPGLALMVLGVFIWVEWATLQELIDDET